MSTFPVDDARAHIEQVAARHGITVREVRRQWRSEADAERRTIYVTDPTTPLRYLIALHEIGHLVDKLSAKVVVNHDAACEAAAWAYAYEHALPELRACMTNREWRLVGRAWVTSLGDEARVAAPSAEVR